VEDNGIGLVAVVVVVLVVLGAVGGIFVITRRAAEQPGTPGEGENLPPGGGQPPQSEGISVVFTGSSYQSVTQKPTGWFTTGQDADIVLGLTDFGKADPTLFNHPVKVATDGTKLVLADTWNNRVLIWNSIPTTGTEQPNIVLGQQNFSDTCPRTTKSGLYMPRSLYFDGSLLWIGEFKFSNRVLRYSVH